ncbi:hypothetical protein IAU59_006072 [Kwoniella sp. CBS 9459]
MASPLPPPPPRAVLQVSRKQNIACDQCRSRKIRCLRNTKAEVCEQCSNRGAECTSDYIDSLAQAKAKKQRRGSPAAINTDNTDAANGQPKKKKSKSDQSSDQAAEAGLCSNGAASRQRSSATVISTYAVSESSRSGSCGADLSRAESIDSLNMLAQVTPNQTSADLYTDPSHRTASERQQKLLQYLFAPHPITSMTYEYTDLSSIKCCQEGNYDLFEEDKGRIWIEQPSEAHSALDDEAMRDLADDLIETFFSIVHPRGPILLNTDELRSRFASPDTHPSGPVTHALLAVILGWGARFSEHPVIISDREEVSARDMLIKPGRKRSRLVSLIVIRAREVAEWNRITRLPSLENSQTLFFLESLLARFQATYMSAVARHLISLGYNTPRGLLSIPDEKERSEAVFVWWAVVMTEGFKTACHRMKPSLYDEDFEFEFENDQETMTHPSFPMDGRQEVPGGLGHLSDVSLHLGQHWYNGCRQITSVFRSVSRALWIPKTAVAGIPISFLRDFIHRTSVWRDSHLSIIGAPAQWPEAWNFQQAITACSIDCLYHVIWLLVNRAMEEFGIAEEKSAMGGGIVEIESIMRRIKEEAEHAALRIAALVGILTENGYLKLDPLIMNHTLYEAGLYLAFRGRGEHLICIAGLRQYSLSFPALWDQADELETVYVAATACTHAQQLTVNTTAASSSCSSSTSIPLSSLGDLGQGQDHRQGHRCVTPHQPVPLPTAASSSLPGSSGPCYGNALGMVHNNIDGTPNSADFSTVISSNTPELVTPSLAALPPSAPLPAAATTTSASATATGSANTMGGLPLPLPAAPTSQTQCSAPFSRNSAKGHRFRQTTKAHYVNREERCTSMPAGSGTGVTVEDNGSNRVPGPSGGDPESDLPGVMFDWAASSLGGA